MMNEAIDGLYFLSVFYRKLADVGSCYSSPEERRVAWAMYAARGISRITF